MTPRPKDLAGLYAAAEADLKAEPRVSTTLRWAFWHADAIGERDMRRDRAFAYRTAGAEDGIVRAADDLVRESTACAQACANVLEMLRSRKKAAPAATTGQRAREGSVTPIASARRTSQDTSPAKVGQSAAGAGGTRKGDPAQ